MIANKSKKHYLPLLCLTVLAVMWLIIVLGTYYYPQLWRPLLQGQWGVTLKQVELSGLLQLRPGDFTAGKSAFLRAIRGILGATILLLSALSLGRLICLALKWRFDSRREAGAFYSALGIGGLTYIGMGLALVGLFRPLILMAVVSLSLLGGGISLLKEKKRPARFRLRPILARNWLWIICAGLAMGMAFIAALAPQWEYDAVWYHLYFARLYLSQGYLVDLVAEFPSLFPMTWEIWFAYGLLFGGQIAATLLHFFCLVLTGLIVFEIVRRYLPGVSPWLAVALFSAVPLMVWEGATAYIDLAVMFHVTLGLYALLRYAQAQKGMWLWLAAINLGLALATKHLALLVVPIFGGGLFIFLLWKYQLWKQIQARLWQVVGPPLLLGSIALLIALPWYVRSWQASGDPLFPMLFPLLGAPPERWDAIAHDGLMAFEEMFGRPRTFFNQLTLPWHVTMHAAAYDGSLGPLFLALLPFLVIRPKRNPVLWTLFAFAAIYIIAWASPLGEFELRWLVVVVPVLAILAAAAFSRLTVLLRFGPGRWAVWLTSIALALLLLLNLPPFTFYHQRDLVGWDGWLNNTLHGLPLQVVIGAETVDDYLGARIHTYRGWQFVNQNIPAEAKFLSWSGGDHFYSQPERLNVISSGLRPVAWAETGREDEVLQRLANLGITHLFIDNEFLSIYGFPPETRWDDFAITGPTAFANWYELLYQDDRVSVYRIRWEALNQNTNGGGS